MYFFMDHAMNLRNKEPFTCSLGTHYLCPIPVSYLVRSYKAISVASVIEYHCPMLSMELPPLLFDVDLEEEDEDELPPPRVTSRSARRRTWRSLTVGAALVVGVVLLVVGSYHQAGDYASSLDLVIKSSDNSADTMIVATAVDPTLTTAGPTTMREVLYEDDDPEEDDDDTDLDHDEYDVDKSVAMTEDDIDIIDTMLMTFLTESSFARNQVIELILQQYNNSTLMNTSSSSSSLFDKLDSALQEIVEEDKVNREDVDTNSNINYTASSDNSMHTMLLFYLTKSSVARMKIINLITNEYISPLSPCPDVYDKLDNAIELIQLLEDDNQPVQIKDHSFLFVGSVGAAMNHEGLVKHQITHIINLSTSAKCHKWDDIKYTCVTGIRESSMMLSHLDELDNAVDIIEATRKAGKHVMSQCWYGRNRSVTLLVAYLMKYEGMDAEEANDLIRETRPEADPYFDVLQAYYEEYLVEDIKR